MADISLRALFPLLLVGLLVGAPAAGFAQDDVMDFGGDDGAEWDEEEGMDFGGDDGGMDFGQDEVVAQDDARQNYTVAVVVIPSDALDSAQRRELQAKLQGALKLKPNYEAQNSEAVLNALDANGMDTCVSEPLCLASAGVDGGVDRILMGRVRNTPAGLAFNVDLFDVENKLFVQYTSVNRLANFDAVLESVEPAMKNIFNIRVTREQPNYGDETSSGTVQRVIAYSAAGLAVAALAGGIYFGLDASSIEDDLMAKKNASGGFDLSQVEADRRMRDAQGSALTANILYGASAGLAIVSGILFYVQSGSDVSSGDPRRRAGILETLEIAPQVGRGTVGMGAGFSF